MVSLLWNDEVEGTLLVVAAACVFAVVAVIVKTDPLPVLLATELRFVVSWIISIAFMLLFQKKLNLRWLGPPGSQRWLILKGVLQVSFITCWWTALQRAPVGNCVAIIYSSPILTSVFSRLLLKEPLGSQFPLQVLLSVIGVMLILGLPFHGLLSVAFWRHSWSSSGEEYHFVFLALLFSALLPLVTKQTQECSWIEVVHVTALLASFLLNPALLLGDVLLGGGHAIPGDGLGVREAALIILAAGGSFLGVALETRGYQLAQVGRASMFRYVEVPFAYFLQTCFTHEQVKFRALLGSMSVIASASPSTPRLPGETISPKATLEQFDFDLEKGCCWNSQAGATKLRTGNPRRILRLRTSASRWSSCSSVNSDEFHLMNEGLELLMIARRKPDKQSIDFWLPEDGEQQAPPVPAFCMRYQKEGDEWVLVQSRCEGCLSASPATFLGRGQQVARIQHTRRRVEKCNVHFVDLYVPPLLNEQSTLWCPACTNKDLGSKTPLSVGGSSSPTTKTAGLFPAWRQRLVDRSPSFHLLPPEGAAALHLQSKLPTWSSELESLIQNFEELGTDRVGLHPSPRNFMVQAEGKVVMQHAQIAENTWCLDFKHPLSVIQAFAGAMSSLDWD
eukprot:g1600.t1